jgi:hypothetical protein
MMRYRLKSCPRFRLHIRSQFLVSYFVPDTYVKLLGLGTLPSHLGLPRVLLLDHRGLPGDFMQFKLGYWLQCNYIYKK